MDIVVKGRNVEVPEHFRVHVDDKLTRLERYDRKPIHVDVELFHEPNPRQTKNCQRIEITAKGRGPAVRAEACSSDFYGALDSAAHKLEKRLRKMHDRRKVHYGRHNPTSVAEATAAANAEPVAQTLGTATALLENSEEHVRETTLEPVDEHVHTADVPSQRHESDGYEPGQIIRRKEHTAEPMTVDQALYEMELVGHDFYLFSDADTGRPSVVYRRKGFDYGVISLV